MPLTRLRQIALLVRPSLRVVPWWSLLGASAVAAALVFVRTNAGCTLTEEGLPCLAQQTQVEALRVAMLLIAVGAATAVDDVTEEVVLHSPTPRSLPRLLRVALTAPAIALLWMGVVSVANRYASPEVAALPIADLNIELVAVVLVADTLATVAARLWQVSRGSMIGGPAILAVAAAMVVFPQSRGILVDDPAGPGWSGAHATWLVVAVVAGIALVASTVERRGRFGARQAGGRSLWKAPPAGSNL